MKSVLEHTCDLLASGYPAILATVTASSGSTPRSSGARMLIKPDSAIEGTIGGGIVEAMVQEEGEKLFLTKHDLTEHSLADSHTPSPPNVATLRQFNLDNSLAAGSGMVCGGSVTVLLELLQPDQLPVFQEAAECLRKGIRCILAASYKEYDSLTVGKNNMPLLERVLLPADTCQQKIAPQQLAGLTPRQATTLFQEAAGSALPITQPHHSAFAIAEAHHPLPTVVLFGAGHVAVPTARLASMTDFRVVVVDDRDDFANTDRFPKADAVHVVNHFAKACEGLTIHEDCYLIIVTRGHQHDKTVLKQALVTPARYIGMIGSKRKRDSVYQALLQEGVTQEAIDKCYCPIGLSINAQTPEEIAVSIMAEIIQARHASRPKEA